MHAFKCDMIERERKESMSSSFCCNDSFLIVLLFFLQPARDCDLV
jgi:hypothetical protein